MKTFKMDDKLRKRLYKIVRYKTSRWKKLSWIYILLTVLWIGGSLWLFFSGITEPVHYDETPVLFVKIESFLMAFILPFLFIETPNLIFLARLFFPVAEIKMPKEHKVTIKETELLSDWVVDPLMLRAAEATAVKTVLPYSEITKIVWNETLQRLEIHGNFIQKAKSVSTNKWEDRDRIHFTLNKKEKVLHIYAYFPEMQDLMATLEAYSGIKIETTSSSR